MTAPDPRVGEIEAVTNDPASPEHFPPLHAYAAAGFTLCGVQTGGAISRHDGYDGPANLATADDMHVTCAKCKEKL